MKAILKYLLICYSGCLFAQNIKVIPVAEGWAQNSVNTVIFRKNSLTSNQKAQYIAFYNQNGKVVLGKRALNTTHWTLKATQYTGNVKDAHRDISIMLDGEGYLHMAWNHHNNQLHYCKSKTPGSLDMGPEIPMIGEKETKVSYPEFYRMPNGDLIFLYRDGGSGNGDLVMNHYDVKKKKWNRVQSNLIDGEGQRNAYWQTTIDSKGTIHISWVWRESPDVASNHDLCYAKSTDGGKTWEKSDATVYQLPITLKTAEYALKIPQNRELINQTSMAADAKGNPYIATYWRDVDSKIPQYRLVYLKNGQWQQTIVGERKTPFSLSGGGTKKIPIARPQVLLGSSNAVYFLFRDQERGSKVSLMSCKDIDQAQWNCINLSAESVGDWEPTYDSNLWQSKKILDVFAQSVAQGDGETTEQIKPQQINVIGYKPNQ